MNIYHGYGEVYIGAAGGGNELLLGETTDFTLGPAPDLVIRSDSRGGAIYAAEAAVVEQVESVSFTARDLSTAALALWLGGAVGTPPMSGSPATSPSPAEPGRWYQFCDPPGECTVSGVSYANEGSPVLGTHYALDEDRGRILTLLSGLGEVTVSYAIVTPPVGVVGLGRTQVCSVRLLGGNRACGGWPWDVYIAQCALLASGEVALKGADWSSLAFTGTVLQRSLRVTARGSA